MKLSQWIEWMLAVAAFLASVSIGVVLGLIFAWAMR